MAQIDKLKAAFRDCSGPFAWAKFEKIIAGMGYDLHKKSGGSGRTYVHPNTKDIVKLHEPHDGEMKSGMVKRLQEHFAERGLI